MALRTLFIHGNDFDQKYAHYASKHFPKYEEFWARYIGCDSSNGQIAKSLRIDGIEPNVDKDILRKLIWEWNYTIFLNYIHLDELSKKIPPFTIDRFTELERIHLLSSHLYYTATECLKKIKGKLSLGIKGKEIEIHGYSLYRNVLAHNVRPFVRVNGNEYFIVDPNVTSQLGSMFPKEHDNNKLVWADDLIKQNINFISLKDAIECLKSKLKKGFNLVLEKEIDKFNDMNFPQLDKAPEPGGDNDRYGNPIVSGMDFYGRNILPKKIESNNLPLMIKSKEHKALENVEKILAAHLADINTTSTINSLILSVCFIDVLAGFYSGHDGTQGEGVGKRFMKFTDQYLLQYSTYLWQVRCGLVHSLENAGNFLFNESEEFSKAFPQIKSILGKDLFEVNEFKKSITTAYENYIHDVSDKDNQTIRENFLKRYEKLGLITDFPVGDLSDFERNIIANIDDAPKLPGLDIPIGIGGTVNFKA